MTEIHLNLNNFLDFEQLLRIFPFSNKYEFNRKKVFRLKIRIMCKCSNLMTHNGYNYARKNGFGKVKIGKQRCSFCGAEHYEDKRFWRLRSIDSRTVEGTDRAIYDEIIAKHGEDSDIARIEVLGQFPKQGDKQFIPNNIVFGAQERGLARQVA